MGAPDPSPGHSVPGPTPRWRIAFLSFAILSLELALSRLVPGEVRIVSYFTNLVLTASLFGLGLGCILQEQRSLRWVHPAGLALVFLFILVGRGLVIDEASSATAHFWMSSDLLPARAPRLPMLPTALVAFVFSVLPFIALGQALARAMDRHPRLVAFGWGIGGSLVGTGLFAFATLVRVPPWGWIAVIAGLTALVLGQTRWERGALLAVGLAFLLFARSPLASKWSPYHLVQHHSSPGGLVVFADSGFDQFAVDFTLEDEASRATQEAVLAKWRRPYQLFRDIHGRSPESVLVLGAGTGNDVWVALDEGVSRVVAVEIDPVILEIGREGNPSDPYHDPRVQQVVDAPRHYLRSSRETFDLVVFGTLEARVPPSGQGDLLLENLVYTREALEDARERLAEGGLLIVYCSIYEDWLHARLYTTIRSAFGDRSRIIHEAQTELFNTTLMASRDLDAIRDEPGVVARLGHGRLSTDDWPYLNVERPVIAPIHLRLFGAVAVLVLGVLLLLGRIHPVAGLHANYLFLGMGFTLMESSALVRLALLFGGTWMVHVVVVSSVLATVFLANALVLRRRAPRLSLTWTGLLLATVANYLLPVSSLSAMGTAGRALGAGLLVGVPVFCAAGCFSHLFGREPVTGYPLGMNLVGAMAGGLLVYVAMATGMRTVWLVVLALYALAWLFTLLASRAST